MTHTRRIPKALTRIMTLHRINALACHFDECGFIQSRMGAIGAKMRGL
jgi:hypothetical protein